MGVHEAAAVGFGSAAGAYERSRPEYPIAAVDRMCAELGITAGSRVLDLACGTGKMTRSLSSRGAAVVGLDPVQGMLRQFRGVLPDVPAAAGPAEHMPFTDASFEAVVVAQAFHWFQGEAALAEIHRVLRPGSRLALIWNVRDATVSWVSAFDRIFDAYEGDVMRFWREEWREPLKATSLFTPLERLGFRHAQTMTPEQVVDRIRSVSFIATLPAHEQGRIAGQVRTILKTDPITRGREQIQFPYITQLWWCRRIP